MLYFCSMKISVDIKETTLAVLDATARDTGKSVEELVTIILDSIVDAQIKLHSDGK